MMHKDHGVMQLKYRLPVTSVTFLGDVTRVVNALEPAGSPATTSRTGTAIASVIADPRGELALDLAFDDLEDVSAEISLTDDGRLSSVSQETADRSSEWLANMAKTIISTSAAGFVVGGPPGLAAGAVGGALLAAVEASAMPSLSHLELLRGPTADLRAIDTGPIALPKEPELEKLLTPQDIAALASQVQVDPRYAEKPGDFETLILYRHALLRLSLRHSLAGFHGHDIDLKAIDAAMKSVRREAAGAEASYASWLASKKTTTTIKHEYRLFIDELPTEDRLRQELTDRAAHHDDAPWWPIASTLGLMMTCDLDTPATPPSNGQAPQTSDHSSVVVRTPVSARLATWKVVRNKVAAEPEWTAQLEDVSRVLVAHPAFTTTLPANALAGGKSKLGYELAASGGITKVSIGVTSQRAERAEAMKGIVDTALTARTDALKARLAELETRKSIAELTDPAPVDPLKDLKAQVARSELEARAALAREIAAHPSMVMVTVQQSTTG